MLFRVWRTHVTAGGGSEMTEEVGEFHGVEVGSDTNERSEDMVDCDAMDGR